jgi:hypothetical protein
MRSSSARSGRTRARSCGSLTSVATDSPLSPPTRGKASSLTWNCATDGGQVRGPHPWREGHRAAQPSPEGLRAEPAVVQDRGPGLRAPGLDADARPRRGRSPLGAEAAPAADLLRRRPVRQQRPAPAPPARRTLAPGRRDNGRSHPPARHPSGSPAGNTLTTRKENHQGPWNPAHPARQPATRHDQTLKNQPRPVPQAATPGRVGSRLVERRRSGAGPRRSP